MAAINPVEDGVTHINVYSKGATVLGQLLTNFAYTPFEHPIFGKFASMEGYWYYIATGFRHSELRVLHGASAKVSGKALLVEWEAEHWEHGGGLFPHFQDAIKDGIRHKLRQNRRILDLLVASELPFEHYYYFGDKSNAKVIDQPRHKWQLDEITRIREIMQQRRA